ncbi:hypothetical protein LPJ78_005721 [Coemansia sp. RSA 989]|nr:hypothetical protein LPJ68_005677 [Coemansia sp. RSA 1086]KAJ1746719.1 hypothetical protein LPJ79_005727 [Coemansia sp. RSA 1821]KAJ1860703.1 hypothetical protein LPJ78_005721 [Coemansia sp. RSA 989]KAJ1868876.1 hypothetical protein LPJ55_005722 [Coemansia sp. RSA 990]KAJ2630045.1 transcriptional repressor [Coemansia sp. RSA 1290]KAJ2645785.1 hypothetical protein IWW40_005861 [Coemansia sp. RSA 1250]KAJ2667587.1 hypothetical protein IWW42_005813 [Coemansia sp. RSA 1085]
MATSTPASPTPAVSPASVRSTPGPATKTPLHLGLSSARTTSVALRRTVPSLSIRTADGSCVSILNDDADSDHKRCSSVPGLTPGTTPSSGSPFRAQSTPGAATPQQAPAMLPSLSTLVQAVRMVSPETTLRRSSSTSDTRHHPYAGAAQPRAAPYAPAGTKTTGKRKYKCTHAGCGKAFTTSGHLARHQRIHTGEKNFPCLFPGCTSRFSRQDNMMQHYRTHMSSKSRRNASPRKVVFVEPSDYRVAHSMYAGQVFAGSHPIQHHQQHRPYGPASAASGASAVAAMRPHVPAGIQQGAAAAAAPGHKAHYGLPPMHMAGPSASAAHALSKSSAVPHPASMAFY